MERHLGHSCEDKKDDMRCGRLSHLLAADFIGLSLAALHEKLTELEVILSYSP